jgi:spermidine/putrescine transport system permease protein
MGTRPRLPARLALIGPGLSYLVVLLLIPLALVLSYTVFRRGRFGGIVYEATGENFARIADPVYVDVVANSVKLAGITTLLALALGYPTAYAIARLPARWRTIALVMVVLPFWTNFLIRTYAWLALLSSQGVVNKALTGIGVIDRPLQILYTEPAVVAEPAPVIGEGRAHRPRLLRRSGRRPHRLGRIPRRVRPYAPRRLDRLQHLGGAARGPAPAEPGVHP